MFKGNLASFRCRFPNSERDLKRCFAPMAIMDGPHAKPQCATHLVENLAPARNTWATLDLDFMRSKLVVLHQTISSGSQFRLFTGRDGDAEMRLMRRQFGFV